jgi:hypothetical protein
MTGNGIRWSLCRWGSSSEQGGFTCEVFAIMGCSCWLLTGFTSVASGYLCPCLLSRRPLFIDWGNRVCGILLLNLTLKLIEGHTAPQPIAI